MFVFVVVAIRIDRQNVWCMAFAHIVLMLSHVLFYWNLYTRSRDDTQLILCYVSMWVVLMTQELVSLYGGSGYTDVIVSAVASKKYHVQPKYTQENIAT